MSKEESSRDNFLISISGKQIFDGEEINTKVDTLGTYVIKDDARFITYKEYSDNGSKTSILKIENDNTLTMSKIGSKTKMILEKEKRYSCLYDVGFAQLSMGVFTSKFDSNLTENGGNLKVHYTLDFNSALASENELFIEVKPTH